MKSISKQIRQLFLQQHFVVVATVDKKGFPHTSCKAVVTVNTQGVVYLLDLYHGRTFDNLQHNQKVSITAVNETVFAGFCLKGNARILKIEQAGKELVDLWQEKLMKRVSKRVVDHVRKDRSSYHHPEITMPLPKYLIEIKVQEIVNLAPHK